MAAPSSALPLWLKGFLWVMILSQPVIATLIWIDPIGMQLLGAGSEVTYGDPATYTWPQKLLGWVAHMVCITPQILIFVAMLSLIEEFRLGDGLTARSITLFSRIARYMVYVAAFAWLTPPIFSLIGTMNNAPGERAFALTISTWSVVSVTLALFVQLLVRSMQRSQVKAAELDEIV